MNKKNKIEKQSNIFESFNKTTIIESESHNPWYNLALEEYLLNEVDEKEIILYLWQNANTVVIGRNQNPWKECKCKQLEREGGKLARRLSGGGTVYHDLGNLNYTFIMNSSYYDYNTQMKVILKAVKNRDIDAKFSGRNDLLVNERKFSGNAFHVGKVSALHHGTIMVNTDFEKLVQYLQVSRKKIKAKGIASVRSRVVNLNHIKPGLTITNLKQSLSKCFTKKYGGEDNPDRINPESHNKLKQYYEKYSSWNWKYGKTPNFDVNLEKRFDWGNIDIGLTASKGYIDTVKIYSDAMNADLIEKIEKTIEGISFDKENIIDNIKNITDKNDQNPEIFDIIQLINSVDI
ncbi:MAG: lipoate--protein ligase [Halanaerobiales bacterium]